MKLNDLCVSQLFENTITVEGFTRSDFKQPLFLAKMGTVLYSAVYFTKLINGLEMGLSLGPSLANAFLSYYGKNWLKNCSQGFQPLFYGRYADEIFMLFKSDGHFVYF